MGSEVSIDQGAWMRGDLMQKEYDKIKSKLDAGEYHSEKVLDTNS